IPDEPRPEPVECAVRGGCSVDAEARHRLEQSLEQPECPAWRRRLSTASSRRGERSMTGVKHLAVAAGIVLVGTAAIVGAAFVGSSGSAAEPEGNGELP